MAQAPDMRPLSIGRLAAAGGVSAETVRYYQRLGLIGTPPRNGPAIRRYGPEDVQRLQFIKQAQAAGFSLGEVKELLELTTRENRKGARETAEARANALDDKIARLQRVRDALRLLAEGTGSGEGLLSILASVIYP
jgi:MerR family mercuric resistance operon transcriptional regulator